MKIKTITCHNVYNYGASLQEYALLKFLDIRGHKVSTINYTPLYLGDKFSLIEVSHPRLKKYYLTRLLYILLKLPKRLIKRKRKKEFDRFSKKYIPATRQRFYNNQELKNMLPEADMYICGSDQIWNSYFENGKDPAFYLDFVPENKTKVSYAASFAIDSIEDQIKPLVKDLVNKINYVSVRESSGIKILEDLGITKAEQVLDPVFLLEASHWIDLAQSPGNLNKYIFVYDFDYNHAIQRLAENIRISKGLEIVTVNELNKYADKNYFLEGPEVFLNLIRNAEFVIANSFHAVAFSIIFHKEFIVFNRKESINTRMRDLLELFGIKSRLVGKDEVVDFENLEAINYDQVSMEIQRSIERSKQFLIKAIADTTKEK